MSDYFLHTGSPATWANPTTTKGDLLVATAAAAMARLAVGSDTQVLTADSSQSTGVKWAAAASGGITTSTYVNLQDQRTANTAGGIPVATTWTARVVNTKVSDVGSLCSLASNQMTLNSGTYLFAGDAVFVGTGNAKVRLRNVTDSTTLLVGMSAYAGATGGAGRCNASGVITVAASKALEFQYYAETNAGGNTYGLGKASNAAEVEVYASIELIKIA